MRVDAGYEDGSEVSPFYDAMLAKVMAWAPTRAGATRRLIAALRAAELHGPPTNRDLLVGVLDHADWAAGRTDTGFLDRNPEVRAPAGDARTREVHALAAALAAVAEVRGHSPLPVGVPSLWRNVGPAAQTFRYREGDEVVEVTLPVDAGVQVIAATPELVDLEADGVLHRVRVHRVADPGSVPERQVAYVDSALGSSTLEVLPRFPFPRATRFPGPCSHRCRAVWCR